MLLDKDIMDLHRKVIAVSDKHEKRQLVQAGAVGLLRLVFLRLVQERTRYNKLKDSLATK